MAAADAPAVRTGGVWSSCSPRASARGGGIPWPEERRKTRMDKSLTRAIPSPHPSGAPTWPRGQGVSLSTVRLVTYRTCTLDGPNHIMEGQRRASACATEGAGRATGPHRPARGAQRKGWWPLPRRPHTHDETARDPSGGVGRSSDPTPRSSLLVLPSQAARGAAPPQRARGGGHRRAKKHPLLDPSRRWGALHDDTHDRGGAQRPHGQCQVTVRIFGSLGEITGPQRDRDVHYLCMCSTYCTAYTCANRGSRWVCHPCAGGVCRRKRGAGKGERNKLNGSVGTGAYTRMLA